EAMKNIEPMAAGAAKLRSTNKALGRAFTELKVLKMQPYFHDGEKYRERRKAFGLDRWMVVYFDETTPTASAYASLRHFKDFEYVEVEHYLQAPSVSVTPVSQSELRSIERDRDKAMPANDPLLPKQWHYHNTGSLDPLSVAGADINLFEAWKVTTGKKNVVVAVVDGGIDPTSHCGSLYCCFAFYLLQRWIFPFRCPLQKACHRSCYILPEKKLSAKAAGIYYA
ncbi:subtilase family N-terminal domain-containing protein, partial [Bacteroides heparinolyticus]|uniref:subtilase family N-terminal domain-containing protein n=1 Tax=Prevotella heparinolytica TaxID=28113 RepID=UPI0035A190AC